MLKNKFKIIAILLTIILLLSTPFCLADDETEYEEENDILIDTVDNPEYMESEETENNESLDSETFKKSDVYLSGQDVKIDYVVDGNIFVIAENVTISSQIGGDAFICAKNITIEQEGYIFSNLFAATTDLTINGVVYDVYAVANNISITGYIYRDLKATCNTLNIFGTIGRNAFVATEKINFNNGDEDSAEYLIGNITGDLNYSSASEATIPEDSVGGKVNYTKQISKNNNSTSITDYIVDALSFLIFVAITWLLALWLAPKFLFSTEKILSKRFLAVILFGILNLILIPIISILLLCFGVTAVVSLPLILLYILLLLISTPVFLIALNNVLCKKLNVNKKLVTFGSLMGISLVMWLIKLIPFVGGIVSFVAILLGIGIIFTNILPRKEK